MKKIIAIAAGLAVLLSLTACVPTAKDSYAVGPDLTPNENVEYDFVQIHNDTVAELENELQYQFVTDVNVDGSNENKTVSVRVVCLDDTTEEIAAAFASALLRTINDSAGVQDITVTRSDSTSFGSFWDKFGITADFYTDTEAQKENGVPFYTFSMNAGDTCGLDPDIETYEEEWYRQMEILNRNEE